MMDIDNTWGEFNENFKDFHDRMTFLSKKSELNKNENIMLRDKVHLLISDMKDIISSMERICNYMDCSNVDKGIININLNININDESSKLYSNSNFDNFED